tara:strand:- start:13324 stop:13629 length:306 start_codon:yes stop_codon:yes gene_type:complete
MIKLYGINCPAKTRIKKETRANGDIVYIPQHRCWGEWYNFGSYRGISLIRKNNPYCSYLLDGESDEKICNLKWAKDCIDHYIDRFKPDPERVVSEEYIKYP